MPPSRPTTIDKLLKPRRFCVNSACAEVQRFFPRTFLVSKGGAVRDLAWHGRHRLARTLGSTGSSFWRDTIRLCLIKVAARVTKMVTRIKIADRISHTGSGSLCSLAASPSCRRSRGGGCPQIEPSGPTSNPYRRVIDANENRVAPRCRTVTSPGECSGLGRCPRPHRFHRIKFARPRSLLRAG
jgi:hypothetical protein